MATPFSDKEGKDLFQLALPYEQDGRRTAWREVNARFRPKRSAHQLRRRLDALKRTYGIKLSEFPRCFHSTAPRPARPTAHARHVDRGRQDDDRLGGPHFMSFTELIALGTPTGVSGSMVVDESADASNTDDPIERAGAFDVEDSALRESAALLMDLFNSVGEVNELIRFFEASEPAATHSDTVVVSDESAVPDRAKTRQDAWNTFQETFNEISRSEVEQEDGRHNLNAGELLLGTVEDLIDACGGVQASDVFLDVGSGVGNVIMQMALQTDARVCIGIEVRESVFARGRALVQERLPRAVRKRIAFICADVEDVKLSAHRLTKRATIVYSNNVLFEPTTSLHLKRELCKLPNARVVITLQAMCPRHRLTCHSEFCQLWRHTATIDGRVSWMATLVSDFIYTRAQ